MSKQDMMKVQTCALKVHIHCEGCAHKIKKKLQKVEGVYKVHIDSEQGKVTVSGNVDPMLLINKLEKDGKHAQLWGPQKGSLPVMNNKNIQFDNLKDMKAQKGGGGQIPKQIQMQMQQMQQKKAMEEKFMGKDQKSVKFKLPENSDDEFDEDDDDFDDEFDEDDDEFDEDFGAHKGKGGHGPPAKKAVAKDGGKVKNGGGKDGGKVKKKGGGIDMFLKGILGKSSSGKNGGGEKKGKKGEKNKKEDGKKHGGGAKNGGGKGGKKGGEDFDENPKMESKHHGFNEMKSKQHMFNEMNAANHKGGGGGGGGGGARNMDFMGQMGGFPAAQGMPAAMNGGGGMGMGQGGNPYNPQYMAHMMMMNQQRENAHGAYNSMPMQMPYARPHPAMGYGPPPQAAGYGPPPPGYGPPPPGNDNFTHMFNDENTDSCSIM